VTAVWQKLDKKQRSIAAAGGAGVLFAIFALMFWRARRRRAAQAEQWAAFTAPSEDFGGDGVEYHDEVAMDGDYIEGYEDEIPGVFDGEDEFLDDVGEDDEHYIEDSGAGFPATGRRGR
jgi:hypothetical protein